MGLVESARMVADRPAAVWLTREGMRLVGIEGDARAPRLAEFHHDLYVVDLAQKLVADHPHRKYVTERELKREDTPGGAAASAPLYAVARRDGVAAVMPGNRRVYPDLVTVLPSDESKLLVHEVEHSRKDVRRLVGLMTSYLEADRIAGIRYYVFPAARPHVERAAETVRARARDRGNTKVLEVQDWDTFMGGGQ